ncbi:hypothetical protein EG68_04974 [Paragonimus skrjabini miyazakii]|uniref:Uncharacterized protein n=1 Tax=Paragonimus skrjabini miyazakii TaxID=59628 RepID=A0A8S9YWG3_9TREM|nr:hypothetical protein EG68_04974 [Paragonimus skrjabini miyazakii]
MDPVQISLVLLLEIKSNHYLLPEKWITIGLLWRKDVGIILLVDGVQSTSSDEGGTTNNTERLAEPYVVLGRLNNRNQSSWLTPYMADWENSRTGGQNNPKLRNFKGHIWFGADLVDSPIDQLVRAAATNDSRPGPVYSRGKSSRVSLLQDPEIVELQDGGGMRLNVPQQWQCKTNKSFCLKVGA